MVEHLSDYPWSSYPAYIGQSPASDRRLAMYVCQYYGGVKHQAIANSFNLSHVGSASHSNTQVKQEIAQGLWKKQFKKLEVMFHIVKQT